VVTIVVAGLAFWAHATPVLALLPVLAPLLTDAALAVMRPVEYRLVSPFVVRATERLRRIKPRVIAITGSYGKTTTKNYVAHLVNPTFPTLATPASYNNRVGLARAINEHLAAGTDVFVAEVGTYGVGEIRDVCEWLRPDVAAITAIGPVHLERMRSIETIVTAKLEITERARTSILNVDVPGLAAARAAIAADGRETIGVSGAASTAAEVVVLDDGAEKVLLLDGAEAARFTSDGENGNIAVAAAAAAAVGVPWPDIIKRLSDLPTTSHRQTTLTTDEGVLVIDDTYNANPSGAAVALAKLRRLDASRRAVVTPGMVELGSEQAARNRAFAEQASREADFLVVVGRTNRAALTAGAAGGTAKVVLMATRDEAVAWVRATLHNGDAVLYENDLPDHYP
jgi:UDP-N-acetylmuramoyl-tripeptide--D-alanyl-D-alanine ligase